MFQLLLHPRLSVCSTGITVTPWDCKLLLRLPVVVEPTSHLECVESPPFLRARTHRKQISPSGCPPPWAMGTTATALPPQACVESGQIPEAAKTGTTSPNLMVGPEEPHPHSFSLSPARECSRQAPQGRANRRSAATHIREGEARGARGQPQRLQRTAWRSSTFRRAKWTDADAHSLRLPAILLPHRRPPFHGESDCSWVCESTLAAMGEFQRFKSKASSSSSPSPLRSSVEKRGERASCAGWATLPGVFDGCSHRRRGETAHSAAVAVAPAAAAPAAVSGNHPSSSQIGGEGSRARIEVCSKLK